MHVNTGVVFPPSTLVIDTARRVQKRTKGRSEEKRRIYVEKSQWRNKTVSTFSPLNVRAHRGRALRGRRSASGVRNNTRIGTYSYASLKRCSSLAHIRWSERESAKVAHTTGRYEERRRRNKERDDGDRNRLVDAEGRDPTRLQTRRFPFDII